MVGNLERADAEKIAQRLMSALPSGNPAPNLTMAHNGAAQGLQSITFPSQQTAIITGQLGIDRQNLQYFPLQVGNFFLGQMPLGSLLFEQVRNQEGLAYGISSTFSLLTYRGPFFVNLQTRNSQAQQALNITNETLRQFITSGPTSQRIQT